MGVFSVTQETRSWTGGEQAITANEQQSETKIYSNRLYSNRLGK